jgi:hypothetical protein
MICLEYSVFVMRKYVVLFHLCCLFCLVHCSVCVVFFSYVVVTRRIEFDRKKVEGYIAELVCSSIIIVFVFSVFI